MIYDLAVIGGGPAGYHGASYAAEAGLKTLLFEGEKLGGTCLNCGCVPTKAMLYSAKLRRHIEQGKLYGVDAKIDSYDHGAIVGRKDRIVSMLASGVAATEKRAGVEVINVNASFESREAGSYILIAGGKPFKARNVLVATGSEALIPPIAGINEALGQGFAVTSKELLDAKEIPKALVIVGGGVIGLEMACYFALAGSKVTVVETLPKIGGMLDDDLMLALKKELEQLGIRFRLNEKAYFIKDGEVSVMDSDGNSTKIPADKVLVCVGRKPLLGGLKLENIGIMLQNGRICVDDKLQAGLSGLFFIGDCNGRSMLAHTAYAEAENAVNQILGREGDLDYDLVPNVIYTLPEVASVGLDEATAAGRGIDTVSVKLPMAFSGRYVSENENGNGFMKGVAEKEGGKLVGIQVIGDYASEFIAAAGIMIKLGCTVKQAAQMIYPHPTNSEMLKNVCEALTNKI